jgi:MoaA/NifB/PqqE/SkfB family radical SAM enzyme
MIRKLRNKINTFRGINSFLRKQTILKNFPNIINIEVTNACQIKCSICPMNNGCVKRGKSFLSKGQFNKILDKYQKYLNHVCLSHHGEPLLHKDLVYFIKELKNKGIKVGFITNGLYLSKELSKEIIDSGLDEITFSFDTLDKGKYKKLGSTLILIGYIKTLRTLSRQIMERLR